MARVLVGAAHAGAASLHDLARVCAPPPPEAATTLAVQPGDAERPELEYSGSFQLDGFPMHWDLLLHSARGPEPAILEFETARLPTGVRIWLTDSAGEWRREIEDGAHVSLVPAPATRRLRLTVDAADRTDGPPIRTAISLAAYPNPTRGATGIVVTQPLAEFATLAIFDVRGRLVRRLVSARLPAGEHVVPWDGRDAIGRNAPAGLYFANLRRDRVTRTTRIVKLR